MMVSSTNRLTNGGVINLHEFVPILYKCCKLQPKGVFANILTKLTLSEVTYCHIQQSEPYTNPANPLT